MSRYHAAHDLIEITNTLPVSWVRMEYGERNGLIDKSVKMKGNITVNARVFSTIKIDIRPLDVPYVNYQSRKLRNRKKGEPANKVKTKRNGSSQTEAPVKCRPESDREMAAVIADAAPEASETSSTTKAYQREHVIDS
ncbi:hypothetical protein EVAR_21811_1 [Eumeta japonica]|uniref:Uncharacterized protein n=1 Tax=Eumeta variegata TaxID=151549 RepID=A0A4C1YFW9_EUMVA|nr:hypothetical protein EVAR_21811_1 [Eumeta japonica]